MKDNLSKEIDGETEMTVIACQAHEPIVSKAASLGADVDEDTLRQLEEAMECPKCKILLAMATSDPSFLGFGENYDRPESDNVVALPSKSSSRLPIIAEVSGYGIAAASVGPKVDPSDAGWYRIDVKSSKHYAKVEVRVGRPDSVKVRWLLGDHLLLKSKNARLTNSAVVLKAKKGRLVTRILEESLCWEIPGSV